MAQLATLGLLPPLPGTPAPLPAGPAGPAGKAGPAGTAAGAGCAPGQKGMVVGDRGTKKLREKYQREKMMKPGWKEGLKDCRGRNDLPKRNCYTSPP